VIWLVKLLITLQPNLKIILTVLIAFFVAFLIFFLVFLLNQYTVEKRIDSSLDIYTETRRLQKNFYLQNFDPNEKRIFILGSSQIQAINSTYINEYLSINNQNYKVYNLAYPAESPEERLKTLDVIISAKPKIVLYGISNRDFYTDVQNEISINKPASLLPDPHELFQEKFGGLDIFANHNFDFLENPKLTTLTMITLLLRTEPQDKPFQPYPESPVLMQSRDSIIKSDSEMKQLALTVGYRFAGIDPPEKNEKFIMLKKIIEGLQKNNIEIIIFTTPQSKYYLDSIPDYEKKSFDSILKSISSDFGINIFSLRDSYTDLTIWNDLTHVAVNKNTIIYSDDVAKILLKEIQS